MRMHRLISLSAALLVTGAFIVGGSAAPAAAGNIDNPVGTSKTGVEYRLAKEKILMHRNISVVLGKKSIVLSGTVPTLYQKHRAAKIAHELAHGRVVLNDLKISSPPVADSLIDAKVLRRIQTRVPYTVLDWAIVHSRKGIVTLTGWVHEKIYIRQYQSQAERVPGVRKVVNKLKFVFAYRHLARRAVDLIYRRGDLFPGVSLMFNPPVHVIAVDGMVILEGEVHSSGLASFLANRVRYRTNAIRVYNQISSPA